ncbi:hypothetical protein B566_EDAN008370 [Ephemera danica]|nr:hypothetical protein B566_EDAN008370 [Ephemera danica]
MDKRTNGIQSPCGKQDNYFDRGVLSVEQVWFQNRRAKWRKKEHTKKGPGRPAHNAHPQTCSGEPIPPEELQRKERDRREKKLLKALEKQQKKLALKGIHVELAALRRDWEAQQRRKLQQQQGSTGDETNQSGGTTSGSKHELSFSSSCSSGASSVGSSALSVTRDEEIDVVGELDEEDDDEDLDSCRSVASHSSEMLVVTDDEFQRERPIPRYPPHHRPLATRLLDHSKPRRPNPFSIESLLSRTNECGASEIPSQMRSQSLSPAGVLS